MLSLLNLAFGLVFAIILWMSHKVLAYRAQRVLLCAVVGSAVALLETVLVLWLESQPVVMHEVVKLVASGIAGGVVGWIFGSFLPDGVSPPRFMLFAWNKSQTNLQGHKAYVGTYATIEGARSAFTTVKAIAKESDLELDGAEVCELQEVLIPVSELRNGVWYRPQNTPQLTSLNELAQRH